MIDTKLKDKVVLVTGGSRGIGAAIVKAFTDVGAAVYIIHKQQAKSAENLVQGLQKLGGKVEAGVADLADPANIPLLFDRVEKALGSVDVLVNNAAYWELDTFVPDPNAIDWAGRSTHLITQGSFDHHFEVNCRAVALMMAEFSQRHARRGANWGRIINMSTYKAFGFPSAVSYGASKHALESFSRAAAQELGKFGITVNVVSPGPIQTGYITPEMEKAIVAETPLGRLGQPQDVADVIIFLASDQARWLTGQILYVDGGRIVFQ